MNACFAYLKDTKCTLHMQAALPTSLRIFNERKSVGIVRLSKYLDTHTHTNASVSHNKFTADEVKAACACRERLDLFVNLYLTDTDTATTAVNQQREVRAILEKLSVR